MSEVPPEELEKRNLLSDRYKNAQKKAILDDQVRGIRTAINILIKKEREPITESEALNPLKNARSEARGGA